MGIALADDKGINGVNVPDLLRSLLLFEGVTIRSGRIVDIGHLARVLGLDEALAIVSAPGVRIFCDPSTLIRAGEPIVRASPSGNLRLDRLDYGIVRAGSYSKWLDSGFHEAVRVAELSPGRAKKFENVIRGHLIPEDPHAREIALEDARKDLLSVSLSARAAIDVALRKRGGIGIPPLGAYRLEVQFREGRGYSAETDLPKALGVAPEVVAAALNEGLLGAVGVNGTIDDMRLHESMVGIQPDEFPILNEKLASLARQFDSELQASRLTRILNLVELPDVAVEAAGLRVNLRRLLEMRQSKECILFRDWLLTSDAISDSEIQERFESIRLKLGSLIRSGPGKLTRWAIGTGIGAIPVVGPIAGAAASILDTFLLERVLPDHGALAFLGKEYRSLFE